jgi:transcriptional regulator with XRE-family HTH domain
VPIFLQIAARARHLRELGLTLEAIGRELGVSARTVAKALASTDFGARGIRPAPGLVEPAGSLTIEAN